MSDLPEVPAEAVELPLRLELPRVHRGWPQFWSAIRAVYDGDGGGDSIEEACREALDSAE